MNYPQTTDSTEPALVPTETDKGSRYVGLHAMQARAMLILFAAATLWLVVASRTTHVAGQVSKASFTDSDMHALVIERLHHGEDYYASLGFELRRNGFATRPVFHWRTPAFFWTMAQMPSLYLARAIVAILTIIAVKVWVHELRVQGGTLAMVVGAVFFIPLFSLTLDSKWFLEPEPWVAVLVLLSLGVHARHPRVAVACGLTALALRELALLYVLVMLGFALRERRYREALAWLFGVGGFFVYLGIHVAFVLQHTLPDDMSDPSWLRFGGPGHVVACSSYLLLGQGPRWLLAILTVLAVVGLASRRELDRPLMVVLAYMAAFAVVGKLWNWYWGFIYLPLLAVGLGHSFAAVAGLFRTSLARVPAASQAGSRK